MDTLLTWFDNPAFGVLLTLGALLIGVKIKERFKHPLLNPQLIAIVIVIIFLLSFQVPLDMYNKGGDIISFFIGPMTIAFIIPIYNQFDHLRANTLPILGGILVGSVTAIVSAVFFGKLLGLNREIITSLVPKNITLAFALEVSNTIDGIPPLTTAFVITSGLTGQLLGISVLKLFKIDNPIAQGTALSSASHAIGTQKALELSEEAGAMGSITIGVNGVISAIIIPILLKFLLP